MFIKVSVDLWNNPLDNDYICDLARKAKCTYLLHQPDDVWGNKITVEFKDVKAAMSFFRKVRFECGLDEFWIMGLHIPERKWVTLSNRLKDGEPCKNWLAYVR